MVPNRTKVVKAKKRPSGHARSHQKLADAPDVLTVPMLAALLDLSVGSMYSAVDRGEVPGTVKIGRRIVISKAAIVAWLDRGTPLPQGRE